MRSWLWKLLRLTDNVVWRVNWQTKLKTLWRCWMKLARTRPYPQWNESCTARREKAITPKETKKKARLKFVKTHQEKDLNLWRRALGLMKWKELFGHNDQRCIWRKKGEDCRPENIPTAKHKSGNMFWGCCAAAGTGVLHKIDCIMKWAFQMDNDPKHTAKIVKKWLEDKSVLEWPSKSPELNPMENSWAGLKRCVQWGDRQIWLGYCQEEWTRIPAEYCQKLVEGLGLGQSCSSKALLLNTKEMHVDLTSRKSIWNSLLIIVSFSNMKEFW